jgi:phage-related minor tail protein
MAANTIKGLTIAINGETTGLDKALTGVNSKSKSLQSELKEVERLLKLDPNNTELLAQKQKLLADSVDNTAEKLKTLKTAAEQAQGQLERGEISEEQFRALQREVVKAEQDLNKFESQSGASGTAIEKAGNQAQDSGTKAEKASSGWGKLSSIGKVAAGAVVGIGTAAVGAAAGAGALAMKAAASADEINTLSKQTGLSVEDIQKFQFATEQIDVPLDTLTGSMSKLTKNMATAQGGTGNASEAFKTLGISITDSTGQLRDNKDVFNDAINALRGIENSTQRDALAMQIFGKSAQDLNPLILGGADALKDLGEQAEAAGLILGEDSLNSINTLADATDTFKATLSGSGNLFATGLAEPIAGAVNTATGYVQQLSDAFSEGGLGAVSEQVGTIVADIVAKLNEILPEILEMGLGIITNIVTGISQNLPTLMSGATQIIVMLVNALIGMLPQLLQMGITILVELVKGIAQSLPELIPVAVDAILTLVDTLLDNIDQIIDAGIEIIIALADGLITALPKLIEKAPTIIEKLVSAIAENLPKIAAAGIALIAKLAEGLTSAIPQLVAKIPGVIVAVVNGFATLYTNMVSVGKNVVEGLWNGVWSKVDWIKSKVTGFVDSIKGWFTGKDGFDTHSPSKWAAAVGGFVTEGLANGILKMKDKAVNAAQAVVGATQRVFDGISYNSGIDYAAEMAAAQAAGEFDKLAELERTRNAKIDGDKLSWAKTFDFQGLVDTVGALASNASYAVSPVQSTNTYDPAQMAEFIAKAVNQALVTGLAEVGDSIFDAIPKRADFNVNGRPMAQATWDDYDAEGRRRGRIFAPSREQIASIAMSVMPKSL